MTVDDAFKNFRLLHLPMTGFLCFFEGFVES